MSIFESHNLHWLHCSSFPYIQKDTEKARLSVLVILTKLALSWPYLEWYQPRYSPYVNS